MSHVSAVTCQIFIYTLILDFLGSSIKLGAFKNSEMNLPNHFVHLTDNFGIIFTERKHVLGYEIECKGNNQDTRKTAISITPVFKVPVHV